MMFKMKNNALFLLAIFLFACNNLSASVESSPIAAKSPTNNATPITTIDASSILYPSPTPITTLSASLANEKFEQWLSGTSECILPCWGGVIPGETSWVNATSQLKPVIQSSGIPFEAECRFGKCNIWDWSFKLQDEKSYAGVFFERNDKLFSISISGDYDTSISLSNIFKTYGEPEQIFIEAKSNSAGDPPILLISVLYARQKFLIRYMWWANLQNDVFSVCDQPASFQLGIVDLDGNQWQSAELAEIGMQHKISGTNLFGGKPIADVSDMTVQSFYDTFMESNPVTCITIPSKYWQ